MNRIFKVIWSKTKHCYIVVSEYAKANTKAAHTGLRTTAAAAAVAAMLLAPVNYNYAWAADPTVTVEEADTSTTTQQTQTVYTKDGADNTFVKKGSDVTTGSVTASNGVVDGTTTEGVSVKTTNTVGQNLNALDQAMKDQKTSTALHISSSGDLIVGTKENQTVKDMEIRGKLTSGSISTGGITSTGDVTVTGKMAADGVTDETTKDGTYIKQNNTVGKNLGSLDTQVKANADAVSKLDTRITNVKEYVLSETNKNYVSKTDAAVQDGAIVKAANTIGENVTNLDAALAKETAARLGADAAQDKVIKQVNDNLVASVNTINKNVADGFTALNQADANEAKTREAKDNELNERITNEANGIHNEIKDGDEKLDTRITNVKEYLENQTSENYVSKTDAAVQDAGVVKADKKIGENVTALGKGLYDETAARIGADKAQDKVIEKVNQNMVDGFNTINTNMANGFAALNQADANEAKARADADAAEQAARIGADKKLAEAVNSGISLSDDNVLQKNTTNVDDDGNVTTKKADVTEMILNKGKDNQITLSDKGIKVGLNSGVMDKDGFYAGGDTADAAKAALKADGSIKGGNGKFTVDKDGKVTAASGKIGNVDITSAGAVSGVTDLTASGTITGNKLTDGVASLQNGNLTTTGNINAHDIVATGDISGKAITGTSLNTQGGDINGGAITGTTITGTIGSFGSLTTAGNASVDGTLSSNGLTNTGNATTDTLTVNHNATVGGSLAVTGDITGKSLNVGTGAISGGQITGTGLEVGAGTIKTTGAVETGTLETTGNATIGGDLTVDKNLTVNGTFDARTLSSTVDANNYTTINGGKTQSMNLNMDAATGETKASASTFDENGSNTWAKDDDSIGKSTVTADGISQRLSDTGDNPTVYAERTMSQGTDNKYSMVDTVKDGDKTNVATQSAAESSSILADKDGLSSSFKQNVSEILNEIHASDTKYAKLDQKADTITSEVKDGENTTSTTQTATNLTNTAKNGTITNDARTIANKAAEAMTNEAKTITSTASESVTTQIGDGSAVKSVMNDAGIANMATGKVITNDAATITNTGTASVTNQVGSNKVLVDTTHVQSAFGDNIFTTWSESGITNTATDKTVATNAEDIQNTATGDITNSAANGTITNTAKALVNTATGNMTNTVGGKLLNDVTGDLENKVGGNLLNTIMGASNTTVTGNVTEDYKVDLSTKVGGNETHAVTGNQTVTVSKDRTVNVKGTETENFNALETNVKTDQKTSVGGNQTTIVTGNQTNNVSGSKNETVKGSVTEKYGSQATIVDGDQSTNIGGNQTTVVAKDQTNTVSGNKTETVKGAVNETYGSQTTKVNGDQSTTVTGKQTNSITGDQVNTIGGNLIDTIMGTSTTTVTGKVTEDYKADLSTKVGGDETHAVTGNQTTTVSGNRTVNVKGTETENFNALETNVKTDQKTSVGGNQTTIVTGNQTNNVSGSKNETVKGSVTEKYGSQATIVDGDQSTNIGGNQTTVVAKDQTNTVSGNKTETVKGAVNETYGSQTTKVNGDQSTTVTGKQTNSITGDQVNTIGGNQTTTVTGKVTEDYKSDLDTKVGGNQTTTVTGDSSLSAKNITNKAEGGTIYNKSKDILNEVSGDILNFADGEIGNSATKITNLTGDNTVTSDTNGTTFENKAHSTAVKEGTVTKTTISGNTIETGQATMDYADVMKDLGVRGNVAVDGNTTLGKEGADTTLTVNSTSTFKKDVTMKENAAVEKNLTVNGQSTFNNKVTITNGGLEVTGGTQTDTLHVTGDVTARSYKVGDKTYINANGINANGQKITNVAAGTEDSDAANYGQLRKVERRVDGVENRVTNVENRVDKMDSRIDKVGANAAAMANLHPLEFDEDSKWNVAAAVGNYKGETAAAVGAFYRPNEDVMFNLSTTFGNDENMVGGGLSLRLGKGGNHEKDKKLKAAIAENNDLRAKVDDLTARMDALLSVINPNMSKEFPDVPENHWAYEAVTRLAGNDIVQGYEDGKFHGERTMTRYEMAEIIYNALSRGAKAEKKLVEEFKPELQAMAAQKQAK
ncbi:bacteriophage T4 gp5 trimerisation domain-containing protein [uncultured Mitsuokella sp.]|uniref:ESPR-type extended signal peptide-containing protein n=1 Tax=uncultured Mitsuokella sp. TaxID=453120 RepID=UPI002598EA39|nr:ESPR-type extended signal peptide-containing protein [uncultured Mitsuokella sp.]